MCVFVFSDRMAALSLPGPTSTILSEETRYWRTAMIGRKTGKSAEGEEGVDKSGRGRFSFQVEGKRERDLHSFNNTYTYAHMHVYKKLNPMSLSV